ncbi:MAG TPA: diphthine synthase [Nitrososphaerales archaeon]|nr:diphthine synthase [Nitrososphaerales archaeon]
MGRLSFVGLGLGSRGIGVDGVAAIRDSDLFLLEYYTVPHDTRLVPELVEITGRSPTIVDRGTVEDGEFILGEASAKRVVLAVLGDPMVATTHTELRVRAIKAGIETRVFHAASIASAAASASGLHYYKFGSTMTVTRETVDHLDRVYRAVQRNLLGGEHTLLLLEHDVESGEGVDPGMAVRGLLQAETDLKRGVFSKESFGLVISRLGNEDASFKAGAFGSIERLDFGGPPYCVIVPGTLHFTESEAISAIFSVPQWEVKGNTEEVKRTAQVLLPKYLAKTRRALEQVRGKVGNEYAPVIENAELYAKDAENFLSKGDDDLAMLSIGYAEGLLDSLNFSGIVKIDW